ncbi:4a-hydroxytetrahydrobiopterin dehydratase [Candidatus Micrarchaeota archaeon]|nr:4a-hydroxytetrahydrobiopterin dehydratase [Candidatus Micrarchaeota archaeon]
MLKDQFCVPCRGGIPPLPKEKAEFYLREVPNWKLEGNRIARTIKFKNFKDAMAFVNAVADIAEQQGHHPDIEIHWNEVRLELYTHKIGGLHENDFILAAKIDALMA